MSEERDYLEFDIGDDLQTAEEISSDTIVYSRIHDPGLSTEADVDFYRVLLNANVTYTIKLEGYEQFDPDYGFIFDDPLYDPVLNLYDSSGVMVSSNDDISFDDLNSQLTYTPKTTDYYYISAANASGFIYDIGAYKLSLSESSSEPFKNDPFDPRIETNVDIVPGFATDEYRIVPGQRVAATINTPNDEDAYKHNLAAGETYVVFATNIGPDPMLQPSFSYGYSGEHSDVLDTAFLRDTTFTQFFCVSAEQDAEGKIYASASYYLDSDEGNYLLSFVQADTLEENSDFIGNTFEQAYDFDLDGAFLSKINFDGDQDYYHLNVPASTGCAVNLSQMADFGSGEFLTLSVYSASGDLIASDINSYGIAKVFSASDDGGIILKVNGESGDNTSEYLLSAFELYDFVTADVDTTEIVTVNSHIDGVLETSDDMDWYKISMESGVNYQLEVTNAPFSYSDLTMPSVVIYGEQGNKIVEYSHADFGSSSNSMDAVFAALETGDYFIEVKQGETGQANPQGGDFRLSVSETDLPPDHGDRPEPTLNITTLGNLSFGGRDTVVINYEDLPASEDAPVILYAHVYNGEFQSSVLGESNTLGLFVYNDNSGSEPITLTTQTFGRVFSGPATTTHYDMGIADPLETIDWASQEGNLRPNFVSDDAWNITFNNFLSDVGSTVKDLSFALADDARRLDAAGGSQQSVESAMQFELEQAGDFGSIAQRGNTGSLGKGWSSIADISLEIANDGSIKVNGLLDANAFRFMDATLAARYNVSLSVNKAIDSNGNLFSSDIAENPVFDRDVRSDQGFHLSYYNGGYRVTSVNNDQFNFDRTGKLLSVQPNASVEVFAVYNDVDQLVGFENALGVSLSLTYSENGLLTNIADSQFHTITYEYDQSGETLLSATGDHGRADFSYDTQENLVSAQRDGGAQVAFTYDDEFRLASQTIGNEVSESYTYDDAGAFFITNELGQVTTTKLGLNGSIASQSNHLGETVSIINESEANSQTVVRPDGSEETYSYNIYNLIESIKNANGESVFFEYDRSTLQVSKYTDAKGNSRSYNYDEAGRIIEASWGDGTTSTYDYDDIGNMVSRTNRRSDSIDLTHDAQGHLIEVSDSSSGPTSYAYDVRGNLISATNADGQTRIFYDSADRVTLVEYANGRSLSYEYDVAGRRTSMINQDGEGTFYAYDVAGRLDSVSDNNGVLTSYEYNAAGQLVLETNRNGTQSEYSYDGAGRQTDIINRDGDGNTNSFAGYEYDVLGRKISAQTQDGQWNYDYDAAGQLTRAEFVTATSEIQSVILTYDYDAAGNRVATYENGVATDYATNGLNQYTQVGDKTLAYDADGNLLSQENASGDGYAYVYDVENRLTQVTKPDGTIISYEYDVFGNRCAIVDDGVRTEFLVDPFGFGNIVGEYDANGNNVALYTHGLGLISRTAEDSSVAFYDTDAVGSVTGITDALGNLVNEYHYTPFGKEILEIETIANSFEFNGAFGVTEDTENLHYMRARSYDAELGRFISEDPLFIDGDIGNLYRFAYNSPVNFVDPEGDIAFIPFLIAAVKAGFTIYSGYELGKAAVDAYEKSKEFDITKQNNPGMTVQAAYPVALGVISTAIPGKPVSKVVLLGVGAVLGATGVIGKAEAATQVERLGWDRPAGGFGDPHYITFDGAGYSFQVAGEFTLMRTLDGVLDVQVRQEAFDGRNDVSANTAIALRSGEDVLEIRATDNALLLNGVTFALEDGNGRIIGDNGFLVRQGDRYIFSDADSNGVSVDVKDGWLDAVPFLNDSYNGNIEGLLGNKDGNPDNDFVLPDGTVLMQPIANDVLYGAFADSLRVTDETSLFTYEPGQSTDTFTDLAFPQVIVTLEDLDPDVRAAAEQIALNAGLEEGTFVFNAAVLDIALTGNADFVVDSQVANNMAPAQAVDIQEAPETVSDNAQTDEDITVIVDVLANDSDPESDALTLIGGIDENGGAVSVVDNKLSVTPSSNFFGDTLVTYQVSDGQGNVSSGQLFLNIAAVNDNPQALADEFSGNEDNVITGNILSDNGYGADFDVDGDTLSITAVNGQFSNVGNIVTLASGALLTVVENGQVEYDPNGQFNYLETGDVATDSFEYTIADGKGGTDTQTAVISIQGITPLSTLSLNVGADTTEIEGSTFSRLITFSDNEDNRTPGWEYEINWGDGSLSEVGTITETAFSISRLLTDGDRSQNVSVTITDGINTVSESFTLQTANVAPTISLSGPAEIQDGTLYTLTLGDIMDPGDDVVSSYIVKWGDGSSPETVLAADLPLNNQLTHVFQGPGSHTIGIDLIDEDGSYFDVTSLPLEVISTPNQEPVAKADTFSILENGVVDGNLFEDNGYGQDSDPDGDELSITDINGQQVVVGASITLVSGAQLTVFENGQFQYDPNGQFDHLESGETATDSFQYTISDGNGSIDTETATVTIHGVPEPEILRLGDAPDRLPRGDRYSWINAWSDEKVTITHKMDYEDGAESWSDVVISGNGGSVLAGGDIYSGDLGVSGATTSENGAYYQEIDGTEALRFELTNVATNVVLNLKEFYSNDDGNGNSESVRVQVFDENNTLVKETTAVADSLSGDGSVALSVESGFKSLVVTSGAYQSDEFLFGSLADGTGTSSFGGNASGNSEFTIEAIEFEFGATSNDQFISLMGVNDNNMETGILNVV